MTSKTIIYKHASPEARKLAAIASALRAQAEKIEAWILAIPKQPQANPLRPLPAGNLAAWILEALSSKPGRPVEIQSRIEEAHGPINMGSMRSALHNLSQRGVIAKTAGGAWGLVVVGAPPSPRLSLVDQIEEILQDGVVRSPNRIRSELATKFKRYTTGNSVSQTLSRNKPQFFHDGTGWTLEKEAPCEPPPV